MTASWNNGEKVKTPGGLNIFFRAARPERGPRGVVIIVPGFNAHSGYYAWVAEQLVATGFAVYAVDLRGRGNSDGERFYVADFDDYVSDAESVVALAKSREPGLPVFLLGHSAGGVVSCLYVLEHQSEIAGLISESFAFQLPAPGFVLSAFKGISHLAPHAHILHLKNETFSRDPQVVQIMNDDPLVGQESQPSETMAAIVRADERVRQAIPLIRLPVLIMHGTLDKNANPAGSQFFYETVGSPDKTLKLYEGSFHDPLNDLDKDIVMADIRDWLGARLPATSEMPVRSQGAPLRGSSTV
jgi:alpha-beta hydrolase superfamily lysophospholipase